MPTVFPVIGVPRTGTSLLASILHKLGVPMGKSFVPVGDSSWSPDTTFFADQEIDDTFQHLMCNAGPLSAGMSPPNPKYLVALQALFQDREKNNDVWGFKSPWALLLWNAVQPLFTHTINPIFITRPAASYRASYQARRGFKTLKEAGDILQPFQDAYDSIRLAFPTSLEIQYDSLVGGKVFWVNTIAAYVGKPNKQEAVDAVVDGWNRF